ncbi:MAG: heme-binding protein [Verrucomicrobiales bacterium]
MKINIGLILIILASSVIGFAGIKLTRSDYESPEYTSKKHPSGFEIRKYDEMTIVSTKKSKSKKDDEKDSHFMRLFRYIDKSNEKGEKITMTTPVFMGMKGNEREMSFVLPRKIAKQGAPLPSSNSLHIAKIKPGTFAAIRFKGRSKKENIVAKKLQAKISKAGLSVDKTSKPIFAYYDRPWIPVFLRRNEVLIKINDSDLKTDSN